MEFNPLPIILAAVGVFLLVKLRFFFILHPFRTTGKAIRAIKDKRALRAFCLALAGTLGIGNVFGVAIGLIIGGPGSLFWLLVSMIFAMVIKYAEVVISTDNLYHDTEAHGGMFYVIRSSFGRIGRGMSTLYSIAALLISFVLGASLQMASVAESVSTLSDIPREIFAVAAAILTLFAIINGTKRIEKITSIIIPLSTIIYIITTLSVIIIKFSMIPSVIENVLRSALEGDSVLGGALGFFFSAPLREGFSRGILSNEAGAGTSAMAHARGGVLSPAKAGLLGILEVWFDTGLICLLTGLSILVSVPDPSLFEGGMQLVMYAIGSTLGQPGKCAVFLSVICFAFATVVCWYYYGMESFSSVFGKRKRAVFLPLFLISVFLGFYLDSFLLVLITDLLITVMTLLTVCALIKNSDRIRHLSESSGVIDSDKGRLRPFRIKGSVFSRGRGRR